MFQKKMDQLFNDISNAFSNADDILVAGFYEPGMDCNGTLDKVFRIYKQANMKLKKNKCLFRCTSISFFGEVFYRHGVGLDCKRVHALTDMPPQHSKKEL